MTRQRFDWIEIRPRPKKDGLHESGYRYIAVTGVTKDGDRTDLNEWADNVRIYGPTRLDVTEDGAIRMWASGGLLYDGWLGSDAGFQIVDVDAAGSLMRIENRR